MEKKWSASKEKGGENPEYWTAHGMEFRADTAYPLEVSMEIRRKRRK
jgi:hypothetical protein